MLFKNLITFCLAGTSLAVTTATATTSLDLSAALSAASALKSAYSQSSLFSMPFVTPGGNLLQPPSSIIAAYLSLPLTIQFQEEPWLLRRVLGCVAAMLHVLQDIIITGVPATVLVELMQPSLRSSIGSEFKAGKTPSWYATLPEPVKSYVEALAEQVATGSVNLSATPTPTTGAAGGTGANVKSTTSSKALAAQATGAVAASFMAAIGILGVAIAL